MWLSEPSVGKTSWQFISREEISHLGINAIFLYNHFFKKQSSSLFFISVFLDIQLTSDLNESIWLLILGQFGLGRGQLDSGLRSIWLGQSDWSPQQLMAFKKTDYISHFYSIQGTSTERWSCLGKTQELQFLALFGNVIFFKENGLIGFTPTSS